MELIQGIKISDVDELDAAGMDRKLLTQRGADLILTQVFDYGFFHADLHPGNMFVLPENVIGLVDFGMMGFIALKTRETFIDLIASVVTQNGQAASRLLLDLTEYDDEPDMRLLERDISNFIGHFWNSAKSPGWGKIRRNNKNFHVFYIVKISFGFFNGLETAFKNLAASAPSIKR